MLKDVSLEIENKLKKKIEELTENHKSLILEKNLCYEEYKIANTGDRSENAPLEAAIAHMKEVNSKIMTNSSQLEVLKGIDDLSKYNSVDIVVLYSTVRLLLNDEEELIYRIFPKGVSFIDIGIIAEDSRLASAIMGKVKGDVIELEHSAKNISLSYRIEEIY